MIVILAGELVGLITIDLGRGRAILDRATARDLARPVVHGLEGERRIGQLPAELWEALVDDLACRYDEITSSAGARVSSESERGPRCGGARRRDLAIRDNSPREKEKDLPRAKGKTED
ncbi:hypothetical protein FALBO_16162 [Fusarium albosuccineum]|uniref:Uncharacterized protein n=1 Tax=Fusarium albosuccineum TaxID=1237068 RepID=A0A8H4P0F6_9HYPO|nr:hypothetical protein FALBO_16162 [Fusarium albosuccineum]